MMTEPLADEPLADIAARIKHLRGLLKLKQTPFSARIGYCQVYLSNIEKGKRPAKPRFIDAICHAFPSVNREWLESGRGDIFLAPAVETEEEEFRRVLKQKIRSLPAPAQEMILEYCLEIQAAIKDKDDENTGGDAFSSCHPRLSSS